jgi:hypothetical protein
MRKTSPAIQHSLKPAASIQQKNRLLRPVTPDVQDGLLSAKPILGYETTKAIKAALVVGFSLRVVINISTISIFPPFLQLTL